MKRPLNWLPYRRYDNQCFPLSLLFLPSRRFTRVPGQNRRLSRWMSLHGIDSFFKPGALFSNRGDDLTGITKSVDSCCQILPNPNGHNVSVFP